MSRSLGLTALLLAGCATGIDSDDILVSDDDAFGQLAGFVHDLDGDALEGVAVTAQGLSATTDAEGRYLIDGLEPQQDFVVTFRKSGYAKNYARTSLISWETTTADKTLLAVDGAPTFESEQGGTVAVQVEVDGQLRDLEVTFPADAMVDGDGDLYRGTVTVEITYIDPHGPSMRGAPGDLAALGFAKDGGAKEASEPTQLVSYGMADITPLDEDGEALQLEEGETAEVLLPVSDRGVADAYSLAEGQTQPSWSYDPDAGLWVEEGEGSIGVGPTGYEFSFEATHFTYWNSDQGYLPTCAEGRVVDMLGFPVRSAEVIATGDVTNSISYTDENGFYSIAVMAGDTVTVEGLTYVADRSWSASQGAYIDCPSGEHFCEVDADGMDGSCFPIPDIQIEVCREAGVVMTDNITSHLSATDADNGDRLRAFFWEPGGDPAYCDNPWDDVAMEDCEVLHTGDYNTPHEIDDADGLPFELRPVGEWLEISTGRDVYVLEQQISAGKPFYTYSTEEYSEGSSDYLETNDIDLRGGDVLSALAPGDSSAGMGAIEESNWVTLPAEFTSNGIDGPQTVSTGSGVTLTFQGENNGDGILVIGGGVSVDTTQTDDSDEFLVCRFNDDGSITIPGSDLSAIDRGATSLSVFRPEMGWTPGPDGLPIRIQAFSGTAVELDMQ